MLIPYGGHCRRAQVKMVDVIWERHIGSQYGLHMASIWPTKQTFNVTYICVLYEISTKLTIRVGWKSIESTEHKTATQPRNLYAILAM